MSAPKENYPQSLTIEDVHIELAKRFCVIDAADNLACLLRTALEIRELKTRVESDQRELLALVLEFERATKMAELSGLLH